MEWNLARPSPMKGSTIMENATDPFTPDSFTLATLRPRIVAEMLPDVPFDGWRPETARRALARLGLEPALAGLAFPDPIDMVDCWAALTDRKMEAACATPDYAAGRIRDRIRDAVRARLAATSRETAREAALVLARPKNAGRTARIAWRTADAIWHLAGDDSIDMAHYTKRLTLAALYTATVTVFVADDSAGYADTLAFLDRRIDDVMRFEQAKRRWRTDATRPHFSLTRFLGRLRYPVEPLQRSHGRP